MTPIVVVSDLHVNSTLGLWPPDMTDNEGTPRPQNRFQEWLWSCWLDFCEWTKQFNKPIVVVNGDVIQGVHAEKDSQIITTNKALMIEAACDALQPLADVSSYMYFTRGTEWHDSTGGNDLDIIAKQFNNIPSSHTGRYSYWDLHLELDDKLYHFTHHIGLGANPMTAMWKELETMKRQHTDHSWPLYDVIVRSHRHVSNYLPDGRFLVAVTPAWQLKTAFVFKNNPQALPDIGGVVLWNEGGRIRWNERLYDLPLPNVHHPVPHLS